MNLELRIITVTQLSDTLQRLRYVPNHSPYLV